MSVRQLLALIQADELIEWQAFYNLEPWGFYADNFRFGKLMSIYAGGSPDDFLPIDFGPKKQVEAPEPPETSKERAKNQLFLASMLQATFGGELSIEDGNASRS